MEVINTLHEMASKWAESAPPPQGTQKNLGSQLIFLKLLND